MSIQSSKSSRTIHTNNAADRPGVSTHDSVWGERVDVGKPVSKDDPKFGELQRSLTSGSRQSGPKDEFSLEQRVKQAKGQLDSQGVQDKRLDVAWKNLSVRGVGAEAMFADDIGT